MSSLHVCRLAGVTGAGEEVIGCKRRTLEPSYKVNLTREKIHFNGFGFVHGTYMHMHMYEGVGVYMYDICPYNNIVIIIITLGTFIG